MLFIPLQILQIFRKFQIRRVSLPSWWSIYQIQYWIPIVVWKSLVTKTDQAVRDSLAFDLQNAETCFGDWLDSPQVECNIITFQNRTKSSDGVRGCFKSIWTWFHDSVEIKNFGDFAFADLVYGFIHNLDTFIKKNLQESMCLSLKM